MGIGESFQFLLRGRGEPDPDLIIYLRLIQLGGTDAFLLEVSGSARVPNFVLSTLWGRRLWVVCAADSFILLAGGFGSRVHDRVPISANRETYWIKKLIFSTARCHGDCLGDESTN